MTLRFPPEESGTSFRRRGGVDLIAHYGDPAGEYRAATEGVAVRDRTHRAQWRFTGRQPVEMLKGVLTGRMPAPPEARDDGVWAGSAAYHAALSVKARILGVLHLWREPDADGDPGGPDGSEAPDAAEGGLCAHLPAGAAGALREHLARLLPPRLVHLEDVSRTRGMITVVGPDAARVVSGTVLGLRVQAEELDALAEGEYRLLSDPGGDRLLVVRNRDLAAPAFDILTHREVAGSLWDVLTGTGAEPMGLEVWSTLRVEAGRPAFGAELGPEVLPMEAGIEKRAIDHTKGCYTGQEVVVRVRDRGHVNRLLRRLVLDVNAPLPGEAEELYREGRGVGALTTVVDSPRRGKLALGYLRREVEPGHTVCVGGPDGPRARVEALPAG
ncbi:MAG: hypothetical protein RQ751_05555 [Longimicrobiales bacterium]|nr:hypothetical protein [Longimicrobiales bacterium]